VFHWVNGGATCYNGCGYVQVSSTMAPGDPVTVGATGTYKIAFRSGKWWINYNGEDLGYFPASLWTTTFKSFGLYQVFGEVAANSSPRCTDMGNGTFGSQSGAATIGKIKLPKSTTAPAISLNATNTSLYNSGLHGDTFGFGGPGAC